MFTFSKLVNKHTCADSNYAALRFISGLLLLTVSLPFLFKATTAILYSYKISYSTNPLFENLGLPLLSQSGFRALSFVFVACNILFMGSLLLPISACCLFLSFVWLSGHYESFWYFDDHLFANGTVLPFWFLFISIFFPKTQALHLYFRSPGPIRLTSSFGLVASKLLVVVTLVSAGLSKVISSGLSWASAENLSAIFQYRYLMSDSPFAKIAFESKLLSSLAGPSVLLFELLGWWLLLRFKAQQYIYGLSVLFFLIAIYLVLGIEEFALLFLPTLSVFFLPEASPGLWSFRRARSGRTLA